MWKIEASRTLKREKKFKKIMYYIKISIWKKISKKKKYIRRFVEMISVGWREGKNPFQLYSIPTTLQGFRIFNLVICFHSLFGIRNYACVYSIYHRANKSCQRFIVEMWKNSQFLSRFFFLLYSSFTFYIHQYFSPP